MASTRQPDDLTLTMTRRIRQLGGSEASNRPLKKPPEAPAPDQAQQLADAVELTRVPDPEADAPLSQSVREALITIAEGFDNMERLDFDPASMADEHRERLHRIHQKITMRDLLKPGKGDRGKTTTIQKLEIPLTPSGDQTPEDFPEFAMDDDVDQLDCLDDDLDDGSVEESDTNEEAKKQREAEAADAKRLMELKASLMERASND